MPFSNAERLKQWREKQKTNIFSKVNYNFFISKLRFIHFFLIFITDKVSISNDDHMP